jgi:dTDP-4-amino-4,6-dideoxygalactose transaminase
MSENMHKILLSTPHMGEKEKYYVNEAFETNWIAPLGPNVDGFENDLSQYLGDGSYVAALSSGTAAIHLGLILLEVKSGDEVICQSMTFSASANPIVYLGARPIFVDSELDTCNICPEYLEIAIKDRLKKGVKPKAIIVVHLYGMPAKMQEIMAISEKYNIPVLEDAAEALGSSIEGKKCGTFGHIGILSFNGNKIITTSGGGALISKDEEIVNKARFLATQARDPAPHYQHSHIGYNYRMSNVCAGIGRGQMQVLEERIRQRRSNFYFYAEALSDYTGFSFSYEPAGYYSNRWLTTILIDPVKSLNNINREDIRRSLAEEGVETRPLWKPMHLQPVFEGCLYYGEDNSRELFAKGLCLPSGSNLSLNDKELVIQQIAALVDFGKSKVMAQMEGRN